MLEDIKMSKYVCEDKKAENEYTKRQSEAKYRYEATSRYFYHRKHTYIHDLGQSYIHTHTYICANVRVFFGHECEASFTCMHTYTNNQETDHDTYV